MTRTYVRYIMLLKITSQEMSDINNNLSLVCAEGLAQRLYDRHDALRDACDHIRWAGEALRECRDADLSEALAALEQIGGEVGREADAVHAQLERIQAREMDELKREAMA